MAKSQFAVAYRKVPALLVELRQEAGLTQRELAKKLGKAQSWVYKSENSLRRMDIAEFLEWTVGCGIEPMQAFHRLLRLR